MHPSTIYHSHYQYVFLSMTSRDSMLVPAPTCSLGSSNICIFASPLFPPFPTSRGIHAWIEGGSIEEFVCLISMEGRWSLKRFAIPNLRMIIHSWKIESGDRMENIERFILIEFLSIFFFFFEIISLLDVTNTKNDNLMNILFSEIQTRVYNRIVNSKLKKSTTLWTIYNS